MCDFPGLFVLTEDGWCRLQWSSDSLCLSSVAAEPRSVRPVRLGRSDARLLSSRKVVSALKAFCSGKPSSVHLGAPLPLQEPQTKITELLSSPPAPAKVTVDCGVQTEADEDSEPPCLELVIDEDDVRLFRRWLARSQGSHPQWNVDLKKFDNDEVYKEQIFYLINPLIRLSRCSLISRLIAQNKRKTKVDAAQGLTLLQFANTLGLKVAPKRHPLSVSDNSISDSEQEQFDSRAARLRLRSAKLSREMRSDRLSDIENRRPSNKQQETNKTKRNSPKKHKTTKKHTSPVKQKYVDESDTSSTHGNVKLKKKSPTKKYVRHISISSCSSSESDEENSSKNSIKSDRQRRVRESRSRTRSPIRLRKSDISSKVKSDNLSKNYRISSSRSRSKSPIRLRKSNISSKKPTENKSDNSSKHSVKSDKQRRGRESRSRSRSPMRLRNPDGSSRSKQTNKSDNSSNIKPANTNKKRRKSSSSPSRSRSPIRLRRSDISSKVTKSDNSSKNSLKSDRQRRVRESRSRTRSPIRLRKSDISSKVISKSENLSKNTKVTKSDYRRISSSRSRSRSPIRLRKSDISSKKPTENKSDNASKSKQTSNRSDSSSKSKIENKKHRSRSKSPMRLRTSDNLSKQNRIDRRSKSKSPIQLRKSLSRSPVKPARAEPVKVTAVRADSRSQSAKSESSQGSKKNKIKETISSRITKPSTVGASWKIPKFLYRKSCVPAGREYSSFEDQALVSWLSADEGRMKRVNGNQIWRGLEKDWTRIGGINRSWHSLRNRYLRYILPSIQTLSLPEEQTRLLRANAARGQIKRKGEPKESRKENDQVKGAYSGVARNRLNIIRDDDAGPSTSSRPPRPARTPVKSPVKLTSVKSPVKPDRSPTYEAVTRRFALRSSNTPQEKSPQKHTRRLYNPKAI